MKSLRALIVLCCFAFVAPHSLAGDGQDSKQESTTASRQATAQAVEVKPATARKPTRQTNTAKGASNTISAPPGTVATLCCGSLDPHSMAGENCAYMHTGQGCGGFILACPEGTTETVKQNGHGYCKEGD